jgi:Spy/CpxP family protein refolding chaperone
MMLRSTTLVGLLLALLATAAVAQETRQADEAAVGRLVLGRLLLLDTQLNLTDQQRKKIEGLLREHRAEIVDTVKAVREKEVALRDAVLQGKDDAAIRDAAKAWGDEMADAAVKAKQLRNEIAGILNDQQRNVIGQFIGDVDRMIDALLERARRG